MHRRIVAADRPLTISEQEHCDPVRPDPIYDPIYAGFGWEGQGEITTAEQWTAYLKNFAAKFIKAPYADPSFKVHTLDVPAEKPAAPAPAPEVIAPKAE